MEDRNFWGWRWYQYFRILKYVFSEKIVLDQGSEGKKSCRFLQVTADQGEEFVMAEALSQEGV